MNLDVFFLLFCYYYYYNHFNYCVCVCTIFKHIILQWSDFWWSTTTTTTTFVIKTNRFSLNFFFSVYRNKTTTWQNWKQVFLLFHNQSKKKLKKNFHWKQKKQEEIFIINFFLCIKFPFLIYSSFTNKTKIRVDCSIIHHMDFDN